MKTKFKNILKGIFLTSIASMVSSNEASAISYDLSRISDDNENNIEQKTKKDLSQKYILKVHNDNSYLIESICDDRSQQSKQYQQNKPVSQYLSGSYTVALSECNGSQRSTTAADNCRKRRNQYNERGSHPYTRQRIGANSRNMPDVYTVHNAIKQIDKLCSHCRECHLENKR